MTCLTLILAVFTIADITICQVFAQNFVESALQQQLLKDDDDNDGVGFRSLNAQDLGALLEGALKAGGKYGKQKHVGRKKTNRKKYQPTLFDQLTGLDGNDVLVYDPDNYKRVHTEQEKHRLLDILGSSTYDNGFSDEENDNSLVFVIVKGDDFQNRKTDKSSNNMASSLWKLLSSSQKDRNNIGQEHRYKGFRVRDSYRRARDSSETYSSREIEEKRPLSRPRAYGGGRTPIPYIKHRGDIYEKDN
ncbi:uncharacterized protein LOC133518922 [Cydia pomonella]|uniref:uncharacterized protein LOC133518922 n=1 Tax=Cydia pomonella TaxID=82600 RepID=UPI002ADD6F07|nr:uncharacterized protein LOC133518922 [Cydia pomonella]